MKLIHIFISDPIQHSHIHCPTYFRKQISWWMVWHLLWNGATIPIFCWPAFALPLKPAKAKVGIRVSCHISKSLGPTVYARPESETSEGVLILYDTSEIYQRYVIFICNVLAKTCQSHSMLHLLQMHVVGPSQVTFLGCDQFGIINLDRGKR